MFQENIGDYFEGVSAKYLSAVDVYGSGASGNRVSNQHEIGGLPSAGFKKFLGTPAKDEKPVFRARMVYLTDNDNTPVTCEDDVTWYDVRWKNESRTPEYRLYYKSNEVTGLLSAGDFFLIGKLHDSSLLLVFAPAGSTAESQLRAIFGIKHVSDEFQAITLDSGSLLLPLRLMLEDIGLVLGHKGTDDDSWMEKLISEFGDAGFPVTSEFSSFARKTLPLDVNPRTAPDDSLLEWMAHEERLFRILERHLVKSRLQQGFGERGDDVDQFVSFSLSVQNRRKSRVGWAFENHLATIFAAHELKFERGSKKLVTENNSKPDFLFPGFAEYANPKFPASDLRLLGAKTTCKDRWRQVLSEGARVTEKHLATLEAAISEPQTDEMRAAGLTLVVPKAIHSTYTGRQQHWLLTIQDFIEDVRLQQTR